MTVAGGHRRMVDRVYAGEEIVLTLGEGEELNLIPNPGLPVKLLYEDRDICAMAKPAGMAVHPCALYYSDTVGNWFAAHYGDENGFGIAFRPLYRLDRDTTGILIAAKNTLSAGMLMAGFRRSTTRSAEGYLPQDEGTVARPRSSGCRARSSPAGWTFLPPTPSGRSPTTGCSARGNGHTLLECRLETGRTPSDPRPYGLYRLSPRRGQPSTAATPAYTLPRPSTAAKSPSPLPPPSSARK